MASIKEIDKENSYSFKAARAFYFTTVLAFVIGLIFNQINHINHHLTVKIIVDLVSLGIICTFLVLYLLKKINFQISSAVFVYVLSINLTISSWYYYQHDIDFTTNFLFITFIYGFNIVVAGICIGRNHVYVVAGLYIPVFGTLMLISGDTFLLNRVHIILFLILAFAFAVFVFLYLLENSYKKEQTLKEEIHEKDKAIAQEQNKRLTSELEYKQKQITLKTMFLLEYIENNNSFVKQLNGFKAKMKNSDLKLFNETIHQHSIENQDKYWKDFELSFLKVHPDFFKKLANSNNNLSPTELKLAALIHLGLSSKQIGNLTSTTPESVDVARSRLRAKLNLSTNDNLRIFLLNM